MIHITGAAKDPKLPQGWYLVRRAYAEGDLSQFGLSGSGVKAYSAEDMTIRNQSTTSAIQSVKLQTTYTDYQSSTEKSVSTGTTKVTTSSYSGNVYRVRWDAGVGDLVYKYGSSSIAYMAGWAGWDGVDRQYDISQGGYVSLTGPYNGQRFAKACNANTADTSKCGNRFIVKDFTYSANMDDKNTRGAQTAYLMIGGSSDSTPDFFTSISDSASKRQLSVNRSTNNTPNPGWQYQYRTVLAICNANNGADMPKCEQHTAGDVNPIKIGTYTFTLTMPWSSALSDDINSAINGVSAYTLKGSLTVSN